ncbi:hypothetical protein FKM82_022515 [Ascaphus truei]
MTQFAALQTSRSVRTRRLAAAEENIEVARAARLAQIFKEICDSIICYKDSSNQILASPLLNLPSKKKYVQIQRVIANRVRGLIPTAQHVTAKSGRSVWPDPHSSACYC